MREKFNHLYLDSHERKLLIHSLVELKNQLIQQGRYTDCVDELIFKVINASRLPINVRCLLGEFANIGQIPQFEKLIATIRSREISASIILQSKSQLKALYKDNASTIEGNCDTTLFLGGKEKDTLKDLAEILGKETIDLYNTSDTRGTSQSYGLNYQKTGKDMPYLFVKSSVALNLS